MGQATRAGASYPHYDIDSQTLRERLQSPEEARQWLAEHPGNAHAVAYWRMLGELDTAQEVGTAALEQRPRGTARWTAAAVRLAHVHHWRGEFDQAHALFTEAEQTCHSSLHDPAQRDALLAFIYQHRAKAHFDQGNLPQALVDAHRALFLREGRADASLLASSRQTVQRIRRELDAGTAL